MGISSCTILMPTDLPPLPTTTAPPPLAAAAVTQPPCTASVPALWLETRPCHCLRAQRMMVGVQGVG